MANIRKGDLVHWRGSEYRVERIYTVEARIESVAYPGVFHMVSLGALEVARG